MRSAYRTIPAASSFPSPLAGDGQGWRVKPFASQPLEVPPPPLTLPRKGGGQKTALRLAGGGQSAARLLAACLTAAVALLAFGDPARAAEGRPTPKEVFERRILPIFKSPNPSSCVQCHLAAVDLKNYILPSHEDTFVSLRDQGLIDLDAPEKSKILQLIRMGQEDKSGASLIHQKVRQAELEAFADWIKASAADPKLRIAPKLQPERVAKPARPVEIIRHARKDRLLESFTNSVWVMRFRCMNCHSEGTPQNQKYLKEFGERVAWFKATPEATLDYLIGSKLIDAREPDKSLLLLKPLKAVEHKGGLKIQPGDQGYKAIRGFLEDYAKIVGDRYPTAAALPKAKGAPEQFGTELWLKLVNTPPEWGDRLLQADVYAWDAKAGDWEAEPIATSDRMVWGKGKLWQHTLTLLAAKGSDRAKAWRAGKPSLPRGKYRVKVYVDARNRLAGDWTATLGEADFAGQAEVQSGWREGYGAMTEIDARQVRKP